MSGYSTGIEQMEEEMGFSSEVGTVGLSLYVVSKHISKQKHCNLHALQLGFAIGQYNNSRDSHALIFTPI